MSRRVKNTPRTPEEQQKAMQEFLAAHEESQAEKPKKGRKGSASSLFLRSRRSSSQPKPSSPPSTPPPSSPPIERKTVDQTASPPGFRMVLPKDIQLKPLRPTSTTPASASPDPIRPQNTFTSSTETSKPAKPAKPQKPPKPGTILNRGASSGSIPSIPSKLNISVSPVVARKPQTKLREPPLRTGKQSPTERPNSVSYSANITRGFSQTDQTPAKPTAQIERSPSCSPIQNRPDLSTTRSNSVKILTPFGDYLVQRRTPVKKEEEEENEEKQEENPIVLDTSGDKGPIIAKTSKNRPLTPEEQLAAFEQYEAALKLEKQQAKEPKITKTSKNRPLSPEEQLAAFEEYAASLKKETKPKEIVMKKTKKNQPLTPEEQQAAFDEFLQAMEKEREQELIIAKTSKNRPLTPEEQQRAFEEYEASLAQNAAVFMKATIGAKNEPRTPEQQKNALKEFLKQMKAVEAPENCSPIPMAGEFSKFLLVNYDIVAAALDAAKNINQQEVVNAILDFFFQQGAELKLILHCLQKDLDKNEVETTLFRDNTPGTQLFSAYCKKRGREYIEGILAVFLERLIYRKEALEIDPCRCSEEEAAINAKLLFDMISEILDRVFVSQPEIPKGLGILFHKLQEMVRAKYPTQVAKMSGGFYFLRFFSPMAVSPKLNGLVDCNISSACRRTLILCTKVIQSLSNNVPFTTEEYMLPFNDIIISRQPDVEKFLLSIGQYENLKDTEVELTEEEAENVQNKALRVLANSFAKNFNEITNLVTKCEGTGGNLDSLAKLLSGIHSQENIGWDSEL